MKNKKDVELQVSELTQEQKNMVLKIGKYYILILAAIALPIFALVGWNFFRVIQVEKYGNVAADLMMCNIVTLSAVLVYVIASLVFVRVKFPFYSDKKYKYLKKNKTVKTQEESNENEDMH